MNKRKAIIIAAILLGLTAILAVIHLSTRDRIPEGSIEIRYNGKSSYVSTDGMKMEQVSGTAVNGKGEEKEIDQSGVKLSEVLKAAGVDPDSVESLSVFADDEYSAQVQGDEAAVPDKVFLLREDDGSMRLIVFGDSDSKRNVKNVVRIVIQ